MAYERDDRAGAMAPLVFAQLHTYFLLPFALDKNVIRANHPQAWPGTTNWIDGLDSWIAGESGRREPQSMTAALGPWRRASYSSYGLESPAYTDLLFFHSIVRYVFFDTSLGRHTDDQQNQLRCYTIDSSRSGRLWFEGADSLGRGARAEVTDLRLYLSVQGMGVLSIGVSAKEIDSAQAIWINRRLRKLYPPDGDSLRQGRTPNRLSFRLETGAALKTICEERFDSPAMVGFYPPLAKTVKNLLYFADYALEEYEPMLDENMLVYSYGELNMARSQLTEASAIAHADVTNFLYLGHKHTAATRLAYGRAIAFFGCTAHSFSILALESDSGRTSGVIGQPCAPAPAELVLDDLEVRRTFHTRYYLMTLVAIFYRATLLDFNERSALVSRRLLLDQQSGKLTVSSVSLVNDLRAEFLNFSSYWHFDELTCKQTDNDLFRRLSSEYGVEKMKDALEAELSHMGDFVYNYYQLRNTEAVNRLALLSLIFGGGAVLTGFFGMNFGREFGKFLFEGEGGAPAIHYLLVLLVSCIVFGILGFGTFLVVWNWRDYREILLPLRKRRQVSSLRRNL